MIFKYLFIALISCLVCFDTQAQQLDQEEIRKQLEQEGIDEEEVRKRLVAQGYDPTSIDLNNPNQLIEIQSATERIIEEIKAEKALEKVEQSDTIPEEMDSQTLIDKSETLDAFINDVPLVDEDQFPTGQIYGHDLYREGGIKFYQKSEYIQPGPNYVLGPGDNVTVAIWGASEVNFSKKISSNGYIKYYQIPRIYLAGLTLKDAEEAIRSKFRNNYTFNPDNFEVTVSATRNNNVYISGDVYRVGSYNISSLNTAINALAAAGGPSDIGSIRNIQLVRSDGTKSTLDIYKFLKDPSINKDF